MKEFFEKLNLTRLKLELLSVFIIVVCALSVFSVMLTSKTSLTYDKGKITYTGYVKNSRMNGQGILKFENGDVYKGSFRNGVFEGQGSFVSSNGWSYVGQFKKGVPDGKGTLTAKNKKVYKGTFKQGIYQK